jgi:hypothetical protein
VISLGGGCSICLIILRYGDIYFSLGWGVGGDAWRWRRRLLVWEKELIMECKTLLDNVNLQVDIIDQWC